MARIGILTYHRSLNYGAVMQAYALVTEMKNRFPNADVEIIDYMSRRMDLYYKMITLYRGKDSIFHLKERFDMYNAFQRGLKELPLSQTKMISDDHKKIQEWLKDRYDVVIIGSDAVWNYSKRGLPNPYLPLYDTSRWYLSYAASCNGLNISSFDDIQSDEKEILRSSFQRFSYIGVRDIQTEALVRSILPQSHVYHNCDPSLFCRDLQSADRTSLIRKMEKKYHFDFSKPTIAFMLSNHNSGLKKELVTQIKKRYGNQYQTVSLYSYNPYADIPYIADLTPQEWSIAFGLFKLTISKYFHGVLFSLLNGTPVIAVSTENGIENMPNKIMDVLQRLEMTDYCFPMKNGKFSDWDTLFKKIDICLTDGYAFNIEEKLSVERLSAESFFRELETILAEN